MTDPGKLAVWCMIFLGGTLADAESASPVRKNEINLIVTTANSAPALLVLKLDEKLVYRQIICFFDTADGAFEAKTLILRARQKDGEPGQSNVKICSF